MTMTTTLRLAAFAIDCPDPRALAEFYGRLLGWEEIDDSEADEGWIELVDPAGGARLAFQRDPGYRPPTWPSRDVPQMMHLDIRVRTLAEGHEQAIAAGATLLPQPSDHPDAKWRVYADPAGHPFCMCAGED
ncbi:VOC family protein [Saccharopolyspora elongata]|uniref:VOC family protein n=2 Tax=Saccharopolyspora elongata TaxID=2530387 RepID=A0A4R4YGV9_9PSEU|nr:VOC family protein [Saccharopolyspora elongata]TDD43149.1 VOC family protein [Saccharopolyspora elongata]